MREGEDGRAPDTRPHPAQKRRKKRAGTRQVAVWALIAIAVYNLTIGDVGGTEKALYIAALLVIGGVAGWADIREILR